MSTYTSIARNFSEESENRMHSDVEAQHYGFDGALVPGVAIFGHMTYPLVKQLGESWLNNYRSSIRLAKPAYHDDRLTIEHEQDGDHHSVRCTARGDVLVAERVPGLPVGPCLGQVRRLHHPPHRLARHRVLGQWRVRHLLYHFKHLPLIAVFQDDFVYVNRHRITVH